MSVNPVGTWALPDFSAQAIADVKINIENCLAVAERAARSFAPHESSTPDMKVQLDKGWIFDGGALPSEVAAQATAALVAPSSDPRTDLVYVDAGDGTVGVVTGAEAASPVAPDLPAGKLPVALVSLTTSTTAITNQELTDIRAVWLAKGKANGFAELDAERRVPTAQGGTPTGVVLDFAGEEADVPTGWLLMYGQAVACDTYPGLFAVLVKRQGNTDTPLPAGTTVTFDDVNDEVDETGHTRQEGDLVHFSNSGGALGGGVSAQKLYYVRNPVTDAYQISETEAGSVVDITSAGSGTSSVHDTFTIPDKRGVVTAGKDDMGGASANRMTNAEADKLGGRQGAETHQITLGQMPFHTHSPHGDDNDADRNDPGFNYFGDDGTQQYSSGFNSNMAGVSPSGGSAAHNNVQPTTFENKIIKT